MQELIYVNYFAENLNKFDMDIFLG